MADRSFLDRLLTTAIICGAAIGTASPAWAQDTGSRIAQSVSPVVVITQEEIDDHGQTRIEDVINAMPQSFGSQGVFVNNGATGTATVNLRGLGSNRTLVLVNGRRIPAGDPRSERADLNFIPAGVVERVDILTGGASSVYGADAVSGVVNFIIDPNFEGLRVHGVSGLFQHDNDTREDIIAALDRRGFSYPDGTATDGATLDTSIQYGVGFAGGRGHFMAYGGYRRTRAVRMDQRDYGVCSLDARTQAQVTAEPTRLFDCAVSVATANGTFFTDQTVGTFQVGPNRTFIAGTGAFNFEGPWNFYQRPDERYTAGAAVNFAISDAFKPYLEAMFMDDRTAAEIAPSGIFGDTTTINCDNPLMSAQQRSIVCAPANLIGADGFNTDPPPRVFIDPVTGNPYFRGFLQPLRRNVEGGSRRDELHHRDYRIVAGMRGDLGDTWSYDAYYQFGRTTFDQTYLNDFSITRIGRALDVIDNPATVGADPTCRSRLTGVDPACVPYDLFALNSISPEALAYISPTAFTNGWTEQKVFNATITGDLGTFGLRTPWAATGAFLNLGVEYRKESLEFLVDDFFRTGDLSGQGGDTQPLSGSFDVTEAFSELRIPIVSDRPFFHELSFGAGYRYSHYDTGANRFSTSTYKFEGEWAPVRDIRFRANYNRAVRAPDIQELFATRFVAHAGSTDPCAGPAVSGRVQGHTQEECARTGVTTAQFGAIAQNPVGLYNGLLGGNPDLEAEIADSWTAGILIQPRFLPGLALTVDWFDIRLHRSIGEVGSDTILDLCVNAGLLCDRIHRNAQGSLWTTQDGYVDDSLHNLGGISTRGVDFTASYSRDLPGLGALHIGFVGTWLDKLAVDPAGPTEYDCAGLFGAQCGTPSPEWRTKTRVSLTLPGGFGVAVQWRHFGPVENERLSSDPDLRNTFVEPGQARIAAQDYVDLSASFSIGGHYKFRLGANNIFDREPPLRETPAPFGNGNTYPQVYDALGRYIFAGVTLDF